MGKRKDSQVSIEYMMILGFVTLVTIPLVIVYQSFTQDSSAEINSAQIHQIAKKVVDTAESVYYLGTPSQTILKVNMPDNIVSASLSDYEVVFKMRTQTGEADIVQSSSVNITGSMPTAKGAYSILIKAESDHVEVSYS